MRDDSDHAPGRLQAFLADRDEPCPGCGYNLRALQGGHCPECGESLVLRVGLEHPARGAFIVGLIGLSFAGGFSGMVLLWGLSYVMLRRGGPNADELLVLLVELVVSIVLIGLWCRCSRWLRRREPRTRAWLAGLCWLWPLATVSFFAAMVD